MALREWHEQFHCCHTPECHGADQLPTLTTALWTRRTASMYYILKGVNALRSSPEGRATIRDGKHISIVITATELGDPAGSVMRKIPIDILCKGLELRALISNERHMQIDFPGLTPEGRAPYLCSLLNSLCVELESVVEVNGEGSITGSSCIVRAPLQWIGQLLGTEFDG